MLQNKQFEDLYLQAAQKRIDNKVSRMRDAGVRQDQVAFTVGQLEMLEQTIYETFYSNPLDAFAFVPMKPRMEPGWRSYSYRREEKLGNAKFMTSDADDRPNVDTTLSKTEIPIFEFGAAYSYSVTDTEAAAILDFDEVQAKARNCAEAVARFHNDFALYGPAGLEGGSGIVRAVEGADFGFVNYNGVNLATPVDGDWAAVTDSGVLYDDVNTVITQVITQSDGVHRPTDVLLPLSVWTRLERTRMSLDNNSTVLEQLRANNPGVTFSMSFSLDGRGAGGTDRVIAYQKDPRMVEYVHSLVYDEAQPDRDGWKFRVQARGKAAGVVLRYPLSMAYLDLANV